MHVMSLSNVSLVTIPVGGYDPIVWILFWWLNVILLKFGSILKFSGPSVTKSRQKSQAMPQPELFSAEKKEVRGAVLQHH